MKANNVLLSGLVVSIFSPLVSFAQISELEVSGRFHPSSNYTAPADSVSKAGKAIQAELNLTTSVNIHTRVNQETGKVHALGANIQARYTSFSRGGYHRQILPADLYCLNLGLYYYSMFSKKWAYNVFLNTAVNSDLKQVDWNDAFVTGGVVFIRQFSPNFSLGFGAIVHNNLGAFVPWPALTVDWKMGGKFKLEIRTPDKAPGIAHHVGISYAASKSLNLSFAFQPEVLSYDITTNHDIRNRLMSFWQLPFTLSGAFRTGDFEIIPRLGFTALRKYAYGEKKIAEMFTEYPYHGLATNLIFGIGIKYKPLKR